MKSKFLFLILVLSFNAFALIDSQILTKPDKAFMNFFMEGYLSWYEKTFGVKPDLGSKNGNEFLGEVINNLSHWRTPENAQLDQILMGQGFDDKAKPYYNFRFYIAKNLRNHSYIKSAKLPFAPLFVERNKFDGICFIAEIKMEDILWKSVPRYHKSFYLQHYCQTASGYGLKYISYLSQHEGKVFPNPFTGQADFEIQTYSQEKLVLVYQYVKTTHTALLLPQHIPFINQHGTETLLPFDKFTVNEKGEMVIYYP